MSRRAPRPGVALSRRASVVDLPLAACRGRDPELWTEPDGADLGGLRGDFDPARVRLAKRICGQCPERVACGEWAIEHREVGIWGGMTTREREVIRAQVTSALGGCDACADIRFFRRAGMTWVAVSKRMGREDSWAQIHARRHGLTDPAGRGGAA